MHNFLLYFCSNKCSLGEQKRLLYQAQLLSLIKGVSCVVNVDEVISEASGEESLNLKFVCCRAAGQWVLWCLIKLL